MCIFWLNHLEVNREMKKHLSELLDDKCFLFKKYSHTLGVLQ